jgi:hypothetical protein
VKHDIRQVEPDGKIISEEIPERAIDVKACLLECDVFKAPCILSDGITSDITIKLGSAYSSGCFISLHFPELGSGIWCAQKDHQAEENKPSHEELTSSFAYKYKVLYNI